MNPVTWIRWRTLRVWHFLAEANRTACGSEVLDGRNVERVLAAKPPTDNVCFRCEKARASSLPLFPVKRAAP